jgi:hypothetical protein
MATEVSPEVEKFIKFVVLTPNFSKMWRQQRLCCHKSAVNVATRTFCLDSTVRVPSYFDVTLILAVFKDVVQMQRS